MDVLPRVLFVCTYKGGRSQIAENYARKLTSEIFEAHSACFDPGKINPKFVQFVETLGLQINSESPESIFEVAKHHKDSYEYIVCMCSNVGTEMCAIFRKNIENIFASDCEVLHWNLPDFGECANADDGFESCVKRVCSQIETHVEKLGKQIHSELYS